MDLSGYERRLNGSSIGEGFINDTIDIVNSLFDTNPAYRTCIYNNEEVECLFRLHKYQSNIIYLTFRPLFEVVKGDYVEFDNNTYFVREVVKNEIYPKAEILLCNNTLRWKDAFGQLFEFPCAVTGNTLVLDDAKYSNNNRFVLRADSTIYAKIPYNDYTKTIFPTQRFVLNGKVYDVTSINDIEVLNEKGYLELGLTATAKTESDDLVNNIANEQENSGWSGW